MSCICNIAAYRFAALRDLKPLRARLLAQCKEWKLKGTILLSTEGINLFVAGERGSVESLVEELRRIPGLEDLSPKYSDSERQPFSRMLVRIKREIIAFGVPGIDPARDTAPKISAGELKQWLDEGRPVTLLDTRNDYEVKLGTFRGAVSLGIDHFREFPQAIEKLPPGAQQQPIVMFCTGGIRCEKAGPFMQRQGYGQIFQLDGGILKYFEECGGAHYQGECFVFDQRVGLDPSLAETASDQCYACLTPLSTEEQNDERFQKGISCPYCYAPSELQQAKAIAERRRAIALATSPLPGSQPYHNLRPLNIPSECDGQTLLEALETIFGHLPRSHWQALCEQQRMLDRHERAVTADQIVRAGEFYLHSLPETSEPDVSVDIDILYEDEAIVVLQKPAPLPLHPSGRFNRNTLQYILHQAYRPQKPRPAHRLDANTSGLVVFARSQRIASLLQPQFARGEVEKTYLARVHGHPPHDRISCQRPISANVGAVGSRTVDSEDGLAAHTELVVLERGADGAALLEVRPLTGRTNQIRVHLWDLGWPICGDQLYLRDRQRGETQTHACGDPPLCLLAWRLAFRHPLTNERLAFEAPRPPWARSLSS